MNASSETQIQFRRLTPVRSTSTARRSIPLDAAGGPSASPDSVSISDLATWMHQLDAAPDVRQNLVDRIRTEIAAGHYETPDRVEKTIDALASDLS